MLLVQAIVGFNIGLCVKIYEVKHLQGLHVRCALASKCEFPSILRPIFFIARNQPSERICKFSNATLHVFMSLVFSLETC